MALQLFGYHNFNEQAVIREGSSDGIISMEHVNSAISDHSHRDCREITDFAVPKFRKVISVLNRTGHARFRRAPAQPQPHPQQPLPPLTPIQGSIHEYDSENPQILKLFSIYHSSSDVQGPAADQPLKNHFTEVKGCFAKNKDDLISKEGLSLSAAVSTSGKSSSSFASTITGEGSVSNGKGGSPPTILAPASSSGKPPLSGKRCHQHNNSVKSGKTSRCHCEKRKNKVRRRIRVAAVSSKIADIPPDEYSWRKYGQNPIKGSPYPRGYYRCSTVGGCPARKHLERAKDDPAVLIVTYEGEHRHTEGAMRRSRPRCCPSLSR